MIAEKKYLLYIYMALFDLLKIQRGNRLVDELYPDPALSKGKRRACLSIPISGLLKIFPVFLKTVHSN